MSSVAQILEAYGRTQAELARQRGEIWGGAIQSIGQIPQQIQQQQLLKAREQRLNQQAASEQALTDLKLRGEQRAQAEQTALDQVWGADIWDDQGNMDPDKASAVAVANKAGHLVPVIREHAAKWAEQSARTREAQVKADEANAALDDRRRNSLGVAAIGIDPTDDGTFSAFIGHAAKQQWLTADQANRALTAPPEARPSILQSFIRQSKEATERTKPVERDITKERIDPVTGAVITPARMDPREAETVRHNKAMEVIGRQTAGRADSALAETQRHNKAMEALGAKKAEGRPVTSGDAGRIAEYDSSLDDLSTLRTTLSGKGATGIGAQIAAGVPYVTQLTGWGAEAKERQAVIDRVKQVIGKALEGGVLRKEDEIKYEKILPRIGDAPEVAASKLEGLDKAIRQKRERHVEALGDAGYNVSKFERTERGGTTSDTLKEGTEGTVNGVPAVWKTVNGKAGWYAR